ncbi:hypothetical protein Tco_1136489 [Tanacetum coccineum]
MKIEESVNVTFDETPPPSKTSPLVDDDLDEEEAIKVTKKKNLENDIEDQTLEIDEVVNIKESRNHPLENVIGNLNQRTLSIDVIDEILEEDLEALLDEGSEILHSIKGTILEEKLFAEFDEFMAMNIEGNSESEFDTEEPPFEKITFNIDYKIKTSLEEPP